MNEISPLDKVDLYINEALEKDDPSIVFHQVAELEVARELIEAVKSKLFFRLDEVWDQFRISKTESLYTQAEGNLGLHPHSVDRYITMWKFQSELPESVQERPVREKFVLTKMLAQGYELSDEQWKDVERTNTKAEIDAVVRDIKGTPARKGSLQIQINKMGTLYGWMDNQCEDVGYLDLNNPSELVQKAIKRIMDSSGVLRK